MPLRDYSAKGESDKVVLTSEGFGLADIFWRFRVDFFRFRYKRDLESRRDPELWRRSMQWLFRELAAATGSIDATLVVVFLPSFEPEGTDGPPPELTDALHAAKGKGEIVLIDVSSAVRRHYTTPDASPLVLSPYDYHPNGLAHKLIASEVLKALPAGSLRKIGGSK